MQITLCDVCQLANNGIKRFLVPTEKKPNNPDVVSMEICPLCLGQLLCELSQDKNKAERRLKDWIRQVQSR